MYLYYIIKKGTDENDRNALLLLLLVHLQSPIIVYALNEIKKNAKKNQATKSISRIDIFGTQRICIHIYMSKRRQYNIVYVYNLWASVICKNDNNQHLSFQKR